jgi:hypothetical protein
MKKAGVLAMCLLGAGAVHAEPLLTREVIQDCDIVSPDTDKFFQCKGYIQGILDGFYRVDQSLFEESNTHEGFFGLCLPINGVRGDTLVAGLKSHVATVPADAGRSARTVIFGVLREMYPCQQKSAPPASRP